MIERTQRQIQRAERAARKAAQAKRRAKETLTAERKLRNLALRESLGAIELPPHSPRKKGEIHHRDRMITALSEALSRLSPQMMAGSWRRWASDLALGRGGAK